MSYDNSESRYCVESMFAGASSRVLASNNNPALFQISVLQSHCALLFLHSSVQSWKHLVMQRLFTTTIPVDLESLFTLHSTQRDGWMVVKYRTVSSSLDTLITCMHACINTGIHKLFSRISECLQELISSRNKEKTLECGMKTLVNMIHLIFFTVFSIYGLAEFSEKIKAFPLWLLSLLFS